jgi:small-conductance mechanosensitive channel
MTEQFQFVLPIILCLLGLLGGIVGDTIIYSRLKDIVNHRKIPGSQILFNALHRMTFFWFALAGLYGGIITYPDFKPDIALALKKIVTALFLYSVTVVVARLSAGFVSLYLRRSLNLPSSLFSNIAKTTVSVLGALILIQTLGVEITPIITTLGISGLAVGLALKDTLENLFSGFYLIISKQIRSGDYIKVDPTHEGYITDINWRNTTIKELSNNIIVVPNSKLASAIFTNYHLPAKEVTLTVNVGVDYESDLEYVEKVTVDVAKEVVQEVAPELIENVPFIRFQNFGDLSIDFKVYIRVNEFFDQRLAKHIFIKKLHRRFQQEGIRIPCPAKEMS